jgi:lipopolysaccharide export system protein LptA
VAHFSAPVLALALLTWGLLPARSWAEEAEAATRVPLAQSAAPSRPDQFLGALSFGSSRAPIAVTADNLEFDYRSRLLKYTGKVVVTQADMKLQRDSLTVMLDAETGNRVKEVVAEGDVVLAKGSRWATGGRAVYEQAESTVVLSQNAVLHDGPNQVSGERVVVYLDQDRSIVEGGVKAFLYPPNGETPAVEGAAP